MSPLTAREHQIMADVMAGMTAKESGAARQLSHHTVKTQRQTILRKLRAKNAPHAVAMYLAAIPPRSDKWQGTAL